MGWIPIDQETKRMYLHFRANVGEDCWLDVVASAPALNRFTAEMDRSTLFTSRLDITQDLVILHAPVLGALIGSLVEGVANCNFFHALGELSQKLIVNMLVDIDASSRMAGLAIVHVDTPSGPIHRRFKVGVRENNILYRRQSLCRDLGVRQP